MITLKRPIKEYEPKAVAFKQEFIENGETTINGSELLDQMDSYDEWLKSVTENISPDTVNPAWVVTDTYFAFDEDDNIVGIIDLRHELNDFLKDFGKQQKMLCFVGDNLCNSVVVELCKVCNQRLLQRHIGSIGIHTAFCNQNANVV